MPPVEDHEEIKKLLQQNHELLVKNNKLLHTLYWHSIFSFSVRIIWYIMLISLPFIVYFISLNYDIPGFRAIQKLIGVLAGACGL